MKVNNISNSINFKRVIKVETTMPITSKKGELDRTTIELAKVLNNKPSQIYTKEEAEGIKNFFVSILGDYDGYNGVEIRKPTEGRDVILLSGKDAKFIKKMEQEVASKKKSITKAQNLSNRTKRIKQSILSENINTEIFRRLENGDKGKQKTYIDLQKRNNNQNKIDYIKYWSIKSYFTAIKDGAIQKDIKPTYHATNTNKAQNIICEERIFNLN